MIRIVYRLISLLVSGRFLQNLVLRVFLCVERDGCLDVVVSVQYRVPSAFFSGWRSSYGGFNFLDSGCSWQGSLPLCVPSSIRLADIFCIRFRFHRQIFFATYVFLSGDHYGGGSK